MQTTPKLSLGVPRYPAETVPPTMTTSPNATKTVFGTTGTPIRRQSTPSPAAMDRCVTTTVVSVGPDLAHTAGADQGQRLSVLA
ncbi:Uncharacterised protein [Mycobacteroides abscessus subsp. abscessus]|nr:Uncharacterised protein [Mycobacteroides abscessus subsp. abscessus]